jgi:hypothetical protein
VGFVAGPDIDPDAVDLLDRQIPAGRVGAVNLTSDTATYPSGLEDSDSPVFQVPFLTVALTSAGATLVEVSLLAVARFGAYHPAQLEDEGDEVPADTGYEIAECRIAPDEPGPSVSSAAPAFDLASFPLDIAAAADPSPVADGHGNPAIEWVVTIAGREEGVALYGRLDLRIWVRVGPGGNVELVNHSDGSDPPATVSDGGPHGVYVFLQGPPAQWSEVSATWPTPT